MSTTENTTPAEGTTEVDEDENLAESRNVDDSTEADDGAQADDEPDNGNREAAKWRKKLRDTEAERDQLAEQLTGADHNVINYAIAQVGIDHRLWELSEVDTDELRSDTGQLDIGRVLAAAQDIRNEVYGVGARPNPQQGNPSQSRGIGDLADVFRPPHP